MDLFLDALQLITQPPGDLVYFLVTLFALQQSWVLTLDPHGHRGKESLGGRLRRWRWAIGTMFAGRVVLMLLGLLGLAALIPPAQILPPVERWIDFIGVLMVTWAAFGLWEPERDARPLTYGLFVLLTLSLVLYLYSAVTWPALEMRGYAYSQVLSGQIWLWAQMVVLGAGLIGALVIQPTEWEWEVGLFVFWMVGGVAQLIWDETTASHVSGWSRLTALVVYPLIFLLVHRQVRFRPVRRAAPSSRLSDVAALLSVVGRIEDAGQLEPMLMVVSSKLADLLRVDLCALGLPSEDDPDCVRVVALHPPNAAQIETQILDLRAYPPISEAYDACETRFIVRDAGMAWFDDVFEALQVSPGRTLVVVPLCDARQGQGLMLLSHVGGDAEDRDSLMTAASAVADALGPVIGRARAPASRRSLSERPPVVQGGAEPGGLPEASGEDVQAQIEMLEERVGVLVGEIKARDREILTLNRELEARAADSSEAELAIWQEEVQELVEEREELRSTIEELNRDRQVLLSESARLSDKLTETTEVSEALRAEHDRLKSRVGTLEAQLTEAEEALTTSSEAALQQGAVGLVIADEGGQIVMADALARQLLRLPEGNVIGLPLNGSYADPRWTQTVDDLLAQEGEAPRNRAHVSLELEDGTVEADLTVLRGRDGEIDGLAVSLRSSESDLERYEAIVSQANEFRTPMTALTGYTDLLLGEQAGILTEMQQQFLERVKANVEQMNQQLNDLIRVASPDSRPIELMPQPVDFVEIIEEAIMGLAARFRERRLVVNLDLPSELGRVTADRDSLYQIMVRLISNAVLCSKEGTQVVISAEEESYSEDGRHLRISVTDTGGGIAPEDYSRVFRRFYRTNVPLVEGMGETGAGMAVAKTLVEANGGRIWVESEEGEGSTISFVLPVQDDGSGQK